MRITLMQKNPVVGDVEGNAQCVLDAMAQYSGTTDLIIFPELFLTGYPPRDMLCRASFLRAVDVAFKDMLAESKRFPHVGVLLGMPEKAKRTGGRGMYNAAVLFASGKVVGTVRKTLLPTYDVFDEARYFDASRVIKPIVFKNEKLGITICEDMWHNPNLQSAYTYDIDPVEKLAQKGATLFINISASPFWVGKERARYDLIAEHVRVHRRAFVFLNQVGANDELIFDGKSLVFDADGRVAYAGKGFEEDIWTGDMSELKGSVQYVYQSIISSAHDALVLGVRDYMRKCGFQKALIGLSGGIDSAVVCALAVDALGADNVMGITMPSEFSSQGSIDDSLLLAQNLGIECQVIPITATYDEYCAMVEEPFKDEPFGLAEENLQARIRGNVLMAFSNKFGALVLSTGNKSEMAVGYCTLYGDMSGGLSVISDVPKTMVYDIARYINRNRRIIPQSIFDKAPSAELRPNQLDQDSLPPYPVLDGILCAYIEKGKSYHDIIAQGFDAAIVEWVINAVNRNEYKRRQAAPGLKVSPLAFGVGRRIPIAAKHMV